MLSQSNRSVRLPGLRPTPPQDGVGRALEPAGHVGHDYTAERNGEVHRDHDKAAMPTR